MNHARTTLIAVQLSLAIAFSAGISRADALSAARCGGARPWVKLSFAGAFSDDVRARVGEQLEAELARRSIDVCVADGPSEPALAAVTLTTSTPSAVVLTIDVKDGVTHKEVSRTLDLSTTPLDARALTIATSTDELLRASWLEVAMEPVLPEKTATASPPTPSVPEVVVDAVRASLPTEHAASSASSTFGFSFALASERWHGGQSEAGVDARLAVWPLSRLAITGRAGYRVANSRTGDHGDVDGDVLLGGVGGAFAIVPRPSTLGVVSLLRFDVLRVRYLPRAGADVVAREAHAVTAAVSLGLGAWLRLGRVMRLECEVTVGAPLRSIAGADEGRVVTAVSGAQFGGALALGGEL